MLTNANSENTVNSTDCNHNSAVKYKFAQDSDITCEIVDFYKSHNPSDPPSERYDRIEADYMKQTGDTLRPIWSHDAFMHPAVCSPSSKTPEELTPETRAEGELSVCYDECREYYHSIIEDRRSQKIAESEAESNHGLSPFWFRNVVLTDIAMEIAECERVPVELVFAGILHSVSSAIGKGLFIEYIAGGRTPLALQMMGFAASGTGKSQTMKKTHQPLRDKEKTLRIDSKRDIAQARAELMVINGKIHHLEGIAKRGKDLTSEQATQLEELMEAKAKMELKIVEPSLRAEDFTLEALRNILPTNNGQLSLMSDDCGKALQNLLGVNNKLQMPEDILILKGYSYDDYISDRVSSGHIHIENVWINLFWLAQPDKMALFKENVWLASGGFLPRCLIASLIVSRAFQRADTTESFMKEYSDLWSGIFEEYRNGYARMEPSELLKSQNRPEKS